MNNIDTLIKHIPATRYYGSKRRLLSWIHQTLKEEQSEFNSVLDIFGGTATVALLFQLMGKQVTYHDGLNFNRIIAKALLTPSKGRLNKSDFKDFLAGIKPQSGFIKNSFSGYYFLDEENMWLDGFSLHIEKITCEYTKSVFLYCVFQACLMKRPFNSFHRKNLKLRTRDVPRRFGNYRTWNRTFEELMLRSYDAISKLNEIDRDDAIILKSTDALSIESGYDFVYIDPPYYRENTKHDTYLRRYHFLEGLSNYMEWENNAQKDKPEIYKLKGMDTPCNKEAFKDYLFNIIRKHDSSKVLLSYMDNSYPKKNHISELFSSSFDESTTKEKSISHALAKIKRTELMFMGRNNPI